MTLDPQLREPVAEPAASSSGVVPGPSSSLLEPASASSAGDTARGVIAADRLGVRHYVDALTGLRGAAALLVLAFHVYVSAETPPLAFALAGVRIDLSPLLWMGWLGVDVFFVLSGFVLTLPEAERDSLRPQPAAGYAAFIRRRALRVLPAFYVNLFLILPFAGYGLARSHPDVADVLLKLVLLNNLVPAYGATINGVYWSLPVEWDFYLVMPLLLPLLARGRLAATVVGTLALSLALKVVGYETGTWPDLIHQLPMRIDQFVLGMAAAVLVVRVRPSPRVASVAFVAGFAGFVASMYVFAAHFDRYLQYHWITLAGRPVASLLIALAIAGAAAGAPPARVLVANRAAVLVGVASYSLYLWHLPIVKWVAAQDFAVGHGLDRLAMVAAVAVPLSLAASALSYAWIERPFLVARRGLAARGRWQRAIAAHPFRVLASLAAAIVALALMLSGLRARGLVP